MPCTHGRLNSKRCTNKPLSTIREEEDDSLGNSCIADPQAWLDSYIHVRLVWEDDNAVEIGLA